MAIARPKFNINLVMVVSMPFLFAGKKYVKGEVFDKDSAAMKQTRGLFTSRRLRSPNDPLCPAVIKIKKAAAKKVIDTTAQDIADKEMLEAKQAQAKADKELTEAIAAQEAADAVAEPATAPTVEEPAVVKEVKKPAAKKKAAPKKKAPAKKKAAVKSESKKSWE